MTNLTPAETKELKALTTEANETAEASKRVAGFRLKLALRGAQAAAFAVAIMKTLYEIDPRSSLGKATGQALKSFENFTNELNREVAAAEAQSPKAVATDEATASQATEAA